jgi:hypothetical protein
VTLVKRFPYRGDSTEEFSNTYWFDGTTPADTTAWKALADAIYASEKTILRASTSLVKAYGYDSPNDAAGETAAWQYDYLGEGEAVVGTFSETGLVPASGDSAAWIRWRTARRTSPGGKIIYLRKYYHPAMLASGGGDSIAATWRTAASAHGNKMIDGTLPSARQLCAMHHSEDGSELTSAGVTVATYATTRTLKRRGKRNPT